MNVLKTAWASSALVLFLVSAAGAADLKAKITAVEGDVQVKAAQQTDWQAAGEGLLIDQGAQILTGPNSSCRVALGREHQSGIKLHPDCRVILSSLDPIRLDLQSGKIFALARGLKGSSFQVASPTAVASARGTGWGQGEEEVEVFEEDVHVESKNGEAQDVPEGQGISTEGGDLGDTYDLPDDSIQDWEKYRREAENDRAGDEGDDEDAGDFDGPVDDDFEDMREDSREAKDEEDISEMLEADEMDTDRGGYSVKGR
jgi:ferric-dicitrate binding protein FerR (iron transport regulator)